MSGTPEGQLVVDNTVDDSALTTLLAKVVCNILSLSPTLVRSRWQQEPPLQPDYTTTPVWISHGIGQRKPVPYAAVVHGQGVDYATTWRDLDWTLDIYGNKCYSSAETLQLGLQSQPARLPLYAAGVAVASFGDIVTVTELVNQVYIRRCNVMIGLRQEVVKGFASADFNTLSAQLTTDFGSATSVPLITNGAP